jgi:hypothetical protein
MMNNTINVVENFLEPHIAQEILSKYEDSKSKPVFQINEFARWDPRLHYGNYGPVYMMSLSEYDDYFVEKFNRIHPHFVNSTIGTTFLQVWTNGSGINWHTDMEDRMAATIYLNNSWDLNWGGLLLFQGENGMNSGWINPHYNRCVWFKSPLWHSVSLISRAAAEPRISIQLFFERNSV